MGIYNHIGQVVADLERSKRFYQAVLGFKFWYEFEAPEEATAKLVSLTSPLGLTAAYMTLDGLVLELLYYAVPGAATGFRRRSMNEPGLTHLSFSVDDIYATADKAIEHGGQLIAESDIGFALFVRDPDGQLLELLPMASRADLPPKPA